jgi:predicted nucleotidyltransferase
MENKEVILEDDFIKNKIHTFRGKQVILDRDLAILYNIETKQINRAVKRNIERFPERFMFQINNNEFINLRYHLGTAKKDWTKKRFMRYVFTEQGVAMLSQNRMSTFLKTERYIKGKKNHSFMVKITLKDSILMYFVENKNREVTINELSKILKKDYKNVYVSVQEIKDNLTLNKKSNSTYVSFLPKISPHIFLIENIRKQNLLKSNKIRLIYEDLKKISTPFFIAIIFGSYAKKNFTKNSDIDMCIIHNGEDDFKEIYNKLSIHSKLEIHDFHYKEFISLLKNKSRNVGHEIVKDGIILLNVEAYYELLKHE